MVGSATSAEASRHLLVVSGVSDPEGKETILAGERGLQNYLRESRKRLQMRETSDGVPGLQNEMRNSELCVVA